MQCNWGTMKKCWGEARCLDDSINKCKVIMNGDPLGWEVAEDGNQATLDEMWGAVKR